MFLKDGKHWKPERKQFATTLHMYGPKAYNFLRKYLPLPGSRTIRNWLSKFDGRPGILKEAIGYLSEQVK